jgi:phosphate:Na+ symporter
MISLIFQLAGGIGLFLMGMTLLTDGLKSFAGDALRRALVRFTGRPVKAFASGALATALVQSSSATTVTVIGFVSAGLLTFPQAVGVVMGASLGTTSTGWIVSVLGLKVSVGYYALPLVGVGAFLKLLARGRWSSFGLAVAGFGLIFIGIDTLQRAMEGMSGVFRLSELPSAGFLAHLLTMLIGAVMTVVMQSSSAAVATTLTALHTESINFEQAASLVIGAAVGTTVTGALAAIGASTPAKRTALAHVTFNAATGLIAVALLPALLWAIRWAQEHAGLEAGATSLAAFHTTFIAVGVVMFLPFVDRFARAIERLLPEKGPVLTAHLDDTVLNVPAVALEATRRSLTEIAAELFGMLDAGLADSGGHRDETARRAQLQQALERAQEFFARIPPVTEIQAVSALRLALLHALDHLVRLQGYARAPANVRRLLAHERIQPSVARGRRILQLAAAGMLGRADSDWVAEVERQAQQQAEARRRERPRLLEQTAGGDWQPADALDALDATRWLDTVAYHTWRICNYLRGDAAPEPFPMDAPGQHAAPPAAT